MMKRTNAKKLAVFFLGMVAIILFLNGSAKAGDVRDASFPVPPGVEGIVVYDVQAETVSPGKYIVSGQVANNTSLSQELVLRAQISFYDRTIIKGDKPVSILRKDITRVFKPWEHKKMEITLLNEGNNPKGALRLEPMMRVRRQREWNY